MFEESPVEDALRKRLAVLDASRHIDAVWTDAVVELCAEHPADAALTALDAAQQAVQRADADRIVALLAAYEAGMDDLAERWGADARDRGGLPARAFLKQAGMLLRCPERTAAHLLDTAVELRGSFPATWRTFVDGRTTWRAVETVVRQAVGLDEAVLPEFDAVAADVVAAGAPSRLAERLRRVRERLQDDTAVARAAVTAANRRVEFEALPDGEAALVVRGPVVELLAIDHALTQAAVAAHGQQGEQRPVGALRFDIALDLLLGGIALAAHPDCARADGTRHDSGTVGEGDPADATAACKILTRVPRRAAVVPTVALTVPALAWLGRTTEQAILAGYGPIDLNRARELCADAPSVLRVLTDPVTGVRITMDRKIYAPPPDLRRWLRIRDEQCTGLGCRRPAHLCDVDHVQEWHDGGATDDRNLVHLCRSCHLVKSTGMWTSRLGPDSTVTWTSPWGRSCTGDPPTRSDPAPPELLARGAREEPNDCPF